LFINLIFDIPSSSIYKTSIIDVGQALGTLTLSTITLYLTLRNNIEKKKNEIMREIAAPLLLELNDVYDLFLNKMDAEVNDSISNYTGTWRNDFQNKYKGMCLALVPFLGQGFC